MSFYIDDQEYAKFYGFPSRISFNKAIAKIRVRSYQEANHCISFCRRPALAIGRPSECIHGVKYGIKKSNACVYPAMLFNGKKENPKKRKLLVHLDERYNLYA